MTLQPIGTRSPTELAATRVELHWLAQVLGAVGDAFLAPAPDDSQSTLAWCAHRQALLGRPVGSGARVMLAVSSAELVVVVGDDAPTSRIQARGKTLAELLAWAGDAVHAATGDAPSRALSARDYDMPEHAVASGAPFAFDDRPALTELALWFAAATEWLDDARKLDPRAGEVRCWPHHFDIGGIVMLEPDKPFEEAAQLGFGWSPGDATYDQPYLYVTPFPAPDDLPELPAGHWRREGFTGAILTGSEIVGSESRAELASSFLRAAIERTLPRIHSE